MKTFLSLSTCKNLPCCHFQPWFAKSQGYTGIMIAWVTKNSKSTQNLTAFKKKLPNTQFTFSDNQLLSESRSILDFKDKIRAIKAYQIVSNLLHMVEKKMSFLDTYTMRMKSSKCGVYMVHGITCCPLPRNDLGRCYINSN